MLVTSKKPCIITRMQRIIRAEQEIGKKFDLELHRQLNDACRVRIITAMAFGLANDFGEKDAPKMDFSRAVMGFRKLELEMQKAMNASTNQLENFTYLNKYECCTKITMRMINWRYEHPNVTVEEAFCKVVSNMITREEIAVTMRGIRSEEGKLPT